MNCVTWCLCIFQIENISSIYLFQTSGLKALWLRISVSTSAIKMFAKAVITMGVTGLHNSYPRVSASLEQTSISFKDLPLLYETIGGS